jgi:hypothetical protein
MKVTTGSAGLVVMLIPIVAWGGARSGAISESGTDLLLSTSSLEKAQRWGFARLG